MEREDREDEPSNIVSLFPDPVGDMLREIGLDTDPATRLLFKSALRDSLSRRDRCQLARAEVAQVMGEMADLGLTPDEFIAAFLLEQMSKQSPV